MSIAEKVTDFKRIDLRWLKASLDEADEAAQLISRLLAEGKSVEQVSELTRMPKSIIRKDGFDVRHLVEIAAWLQRLEARRERAIDS